MANVNPKKTYRTITRCRVCGAKQFSSILNLGKMPPANAFVPKKHRGRAQQHFPLRLVFCNNCGLTQLADVVNPALLFGGYHYMTSASAPLAEHFVRMGKELATKHSLSRDDLIVEFGSNDGVLLHTLMPHTRVLGVDPAQTAAAVAIRKGIPMIIDFFGTRVANRIVSAHGQAKLIVANNVFAHIDDLEDVLLGVQTLLHGTGAFVTESHWVGNLVTDGGFDQIYHEHLCYFSLHSMTHLFTRFGLTITDVSLVPIHGQSIRVTAQKQGTPSIRVEELLAREREMGLTDKNTYAQFARDVTVNKKDLRTLLRTLKKQGFRIAGYGAPAKGNTLLNYFGLDGEIIDYITDTTPAKQGTFTPGTHIPIVSPDELNSRRPDYLLLLSWNYADYILTKEQRLRSQGVKFIIPVPRVRIV